MRTPTTSRAVCRVCARERPISELIPLEAVTPGVVQQVQREHPQCSLESLICRHDLALYRARYLGQLLADEHGELSALDQEVLASLRDGELISPHAAEIAAEPPTLGERLADHVAHFGGSWTFILVFAGVLVAWIFGNVVIFANRGFDPYPFILLNLLLSCLAAVQAPVIMMSQNRQDKKDRQRAEMDYKVNLKAELEIRHLTAKIDQLRHHQWRRLLEIQRIQTELMEELCRQKRP